MEVQSNFGDFYPMLAELLQSDYGSGTYGGTPLYSAFNFATGFTSAVYDYSYNLTVDPSMYADYSAYYIKDVADIVYLK
jgi:peptide/nickel transport system substrate-binding protein